MKLLRYGRAGAEKPGMLDANGRIRDLSGVVDDINAAAIAPASLRKLAKLDPASLPLVRGKPRIGPCVVRPLNFVCIGLNYADHAAETGAAIPKEPIVFLKSLGAKSLPLCPLTSQAKTMRTKTGKLTRKYISGVLSADVNEPENIVTSEAKP